MTASNLSTTGEVKTINRDYDMVAVDDDSLELQIMIRALRNTDYQIACFMNVEESIAFLSTQQPLILFVDYRMPSLDGLAFIEKLAEIYDVADMSIYLTSGAQVPIDVEEQAKELGAQFIEKSEMSKKGFLEGLCADAKERRAQLHAA